jgi:hypothetical protein
MMSVITVVMSLVVTMMTSIVISDSDESDDECRIGDGECGGEGGECDDELSDNDDAPLPGKSALPRGGGGYSNPSLQEAICARPCWGWYFFGDVGGLVVVAMASLLGLGDAKAARLIFGCKQVGPITAAQERAPRIKMKY